MMDEADNEAMDAICSALKGADLGAYVRALETLHRRPHNVAIAKPVILRAISGADDAQRFDLAFALASLGSRDPAVLEALAEASTPLSAFDALEPFCKAPGVDRVRLTSESQVTGELVVDSMGTPFLTPEEDHRAGGMGAVRMVGWSLDASGHRRGEVVGISGFFKAGVGLLVEKAWSAGAESG